MSGKKTYDDEFKQNAARIVIDSGRPVAEVAEEIGVNRKTLDNWVRARREEISKSADNEFSAEVKEPKPEAGASDKPKAFKRRTIRAWR